jgi:hypothetical protein
MNVTRTDITEGLNMVARFSSKPFNVDPTVVEYYLIQLIGISAEQFNSAINYFVNERTVPTPGEIIQYDPDRDLNDWFNIIAVASGQMRESQVAGISGEALKKVTSCATIMAALNKLRSASSYETNEYRKDWVKAISVPRDPKVLPPAPVNLSLEVVEERKPQEEALSDPHHYHQSNALLRCLAERSIKDATAETIARKLHPEARQKVVDLLSFPTESRRAIFKFICKASQTPSAIESLLVSVPEELREQAWNYHANHKFQVDPSRPAITS